jgi:serine/threonine protein phosphatase 1
LSARPAEPSSDREKFARLAGGTRIWAVASLHGEAGRLIRLHDDLTRRIQGSDRIVYLGNYLGIGGAVHDAVDELITFRRWLLARPGIFTCDVVHLRGAQEEMWSKLLQLQFAPNPGEVLGWLLDHGAAATLAAYGGDAKQGFIAAKEGPMALTRWTASLKAKVAASAGHQPFVSSLRRAAYSDTLLFVHAGIDTGRPLAAQSDSFWWNAAAFGRIEQPYQDFRRIVRGFDPAHGGIVMGDFTASIDAGCGFGGPLVAACFDAQGALVDKLEV